MKFYLNATDEEEEARRRRENKYESITLKWKRNRVPQQQHEGNTRAAVGEAFSIATTALAAAAATSAAAKPAVERVILPRRRRPRHHALSHPLQNRATAFIIFLQHWRIKYQEVGWRGKKREGGRKAEIRATARRVAQRPEACVTAALSPNKHGRPLQR